MNSLLKKRILLVAGVALLFSLGVYAAKPNKKKIPEGAKPQILKTAVLKDAKNARPFNRAKGERSATDDMYGGWARYDVYEDFDDIFGFDITDPTYPYDLATADILINNNHKICAAAWDGARVHFVSEVYQADYGLYFTGYRGILDPLTGELKLLSKTGYASKTTANLNGMTFDPVGRKLYGIDLNGVLYDVSMTDSTSTAIDTMRWQGQKINAYPMTLSAAPSGSLFAIFSNGFLYKIDKKSAVATLVGPVGGDQVQLVYQSATFDRLSGELYWARVCDRSIDLYKVDTLTGEAEFYSDFGLQTTGLFHQYYEDPCDVYPAAIIDLSAKIDDLKVTFSWENPTMNGLGDPVDCFEKIYVYRAVGIGELVLVDSVSPVPAGEAGSYVYEEQEYGYYRYGFEVVNSKGNTSVMREISLGVYSYSLPYETGFETSDNNTPLTPDESVKFVTDPDLVYEGERSAFIPTFSRLRIAGLPFERGTTYRLTFIARGYELGLAGYQDLNKPFTVKPFATLNVRLDEEKVYYPEETRSLNWVAATVDMYVNRSKGYVLSFATSVFDEYYLDNVRIEVLTPNTVPGMVQNPYVQRNGTSLEAEMHWTNPEKTAGDAELEDLGGVIVHVASSTRFEKENTIIVDTVRTTQIGGQMQKAYTVPQDGYWYFRLIPFNKEGISPMDTIVSGGWIGRDTAFTYPTGLKAEALDNGKIRLRWNKIAEKGVHGGALGGSITGYRIIRETGNQEEQKEYIVSDTVLETEALLMNYHRFTVTGICDNRYDGASSTVRLIGGIYGGQKVITDIASDAGFSTHPFNVCTEFSNQSTVNQFIVERGLFKEPCIIDTLYFMISPLSLGFNQKIKIHLGTYRKNLFTDYGDWVAIDSLTEVFAGSLRFEKETGILKIPVKPFYYDGKQNLLVSIIKAQQTARLDVRFINNPVYEYYPQIHDYHLETMSDYYDLTGKPVMQKGLAIKPIFIVNCKQNLNTIKGRVTMGGESVQGAKIEISKTEESQGMEFAQTLYSDKEGGFSFQYFPDNTYHVRISYEGMQDYETDVELAGGKVEDLQIDLIGARKVSLKGIVVNRQKQAVAGAEVRLSEIAEPVVRTAEDGTFVLEDIYGSTRYTVNITHDLYQPYQTQVRLENDAESQMDTAHLIYYPFPVGKVKVEEGENETISLSWEKPLQSINTSEHKYHGPRKSSICSSAEISAAIRFRKDSLRAWVDAQPDLMVNSVAFQASDTTAHYTVRLFSSNTEIPDYEQEVGYLPLNHHRIFLDSAFKIDTTNDLLVAVRVARGYKGCPLANDAGPQLNDGALVNQGSGWRYMSDYMMGADGSNWILSAFFGYTQETEAPAGYRIYRAEQKQGPCKWEPMAEVEAGTHTYTDNTFGALPFGDYRYAVRADWYDNNLSAEKVSPVLAKNMSFKLTLNIIDPKELLPIGEKITLRSIDKLDIYEMEVPKNLQLVVDPIRRNTYDIYTAGTYSFSLSPNQINILSDTVIDLEVVPPAGNEDYAENGFAVYPNPSSDGHFTLSCGIEDARYEVFAVDGRLLLSGKISAQNTALDLSSYGGGVYILKIVSSDSIAAEKLIVN